MNSPTLGRAIYVLVSERAATETIMRAIINDGDPVKERYRKKVEAFDAALSVIGDELIRCEGCDVCKGVSAMLDDSACSESEVWQAVKFESGKMQVRNTDEYQWTTVNAHFCPNCGRELMEVKSV